MEKKTGVSRGLDRASGTVLQTFSSMLNRRLDLRLCVERATGIEPVGQLGRVGRNWASGSSSHLDCAKYHRHHLVHHIVEVQSALAVGPAQQGLRVRQQARAQEQVVVRARVRIFRLLGPKSGGQ
jgi:hypothetical protein